MSGTARLRHSTSTTSHPIWRGLLWATAGITGFLLVFSLTYKTQIEAQITTRDITPLLGDDRPPPALPPADGAQGRALNILLMGSDARDGENADIGGYEGGQRNDTTIIMHISADRSRIELLSIPRDSVVRIPNCQLSDGTTVKGWTGMFNIAFSNGGKKGSKSDAAACTVRAVESLTNIRIDHYAVVDFVGFINMVNAVGGVPMCMEQAFADPYSGLYVGAGPAVLDGHASLAYARMRHGTGLSGSDLDRIDRQQTLLKNLARKVLGTEVLFNPVDLTNFVGATAASLTMDPELGDLSKTVGLAYSMRNFDAETGMVMATVPVKAYAPDPNRVEFAASAAKIFAAMASDQPIGPLLDKSSANPANNPAAVSGTGSSSGGDSSSGSGDGGESVSSRETEEEILAKCSV